MARVVFLHGLLPVGLFGITGGVRTLCIAKDHLVLSSTAQEHGIKPMCDPTGPVQLEGLFMVTFNFPVWTFSLNFAERRGPMTAWGSLCARRGGTRKEAELAEMNYSKASEVIQSVIEPRRLGKPRGPCKSAPSNDCGRCFTAAGMLMNTHSPATS